MADEGPDETNLAARINRRKPGAKDAGAQNSHGRKDTDRQVHKGQSAQRPLHDRRVHPESGGREPERDY